MMPVDDIVNACINLNVASVTVTGGEPLIHNGIDVLIGKLLARGFWVNVETNGTVDVIEFRARNRCIWNKRLFFTVDCKCPTSGMHNRMNYDQYRGMYSDDVLKFVVGSVADMEFAKQVIDKNNITAQVYFSPVFGAIEPKDIVQFILDNKMYNCKVQLQMHKFIWDPQERGV